GCLGAGAAGFEGRFPARLLADPHAVGDFRQHGAANRAMGTDGLAHLNLRAGGRWRAGFGLAHAAELQRAERGETAQSRAAQERTAVETATGLTCEGCGESAAACLAFRPLDQPDRPPSVLRIAIDAVELLDVIGFAIAALPLLVVRLGIGLGRCECA